MAPAQRPVAGQVAAFRHRSYKEAYGERLEKNRQKVQFVNNEPKQIEIRKSQNTLIVVGTGTIIFGIWTAIKMLGMLFMLREETVTALLAKYGPVEGISEKALFWMLVFLIALLMLLFLAVRTYVGMSAISEGRGKRPRRFYLLLAIFMIIGSIYSFCSNLLAVGAPEQLGALTRDQSISALIIELTSMIMMTQMVVSAVKIRKLRDAGKHAKD